MKKAKPGTIARKKSHRWYDRIPALAAALESLRTMAPGRRDAKIRDVLSLVKSLSPDLLDRFVLQFPLNILRRRWYDTDPYLWLVFNGLRFAEDDLLIQVAANLNKIRKR
jgi:hypothetical protein